MQNEPKAGACEFELLDRADLMTAIDGKGSLSRTTVWSPNRGLGYQAYLRWAHQDLESALATSDADQIARFSVGAFVNARRALACVIEQYLYRDLFVCCKRPPTREEERAQLLVKRGVLQPLGARVLSRLVDKRNSIEHEFVPATLADAEDAVQLVASTISRCIAESDPFWSPGMFGHFLGGHVGGEFGTRAHFESWGTEPIYVFVTFVKDPWFGVVLPQSATRAIVRRIPLAELTTDDMLDLFVALESRIDGSSDGCGQDMFRARLVSTGLVQ